MTDEPRRALVIGAHPDDNEFGAGGTIARLITEGWDVTYIIGTNGNKGSHDPAISPYALAAQREAEQLAAAAVIGGARVIFLRYNDGEIEATPALRLEMALYLRMLRPHRVFTHDPWKQYMFHPDHRAVGFAVIDGMVSARDHLFLPGLAQVGVAVWRPEALYLWGAEQPDHVEDIGATLEHKIAALREHHTQLDRATGWEQRVRQRAHDLGREHGLDAAEAFRRMPV
jgi:LmbE family N-acetylglucosaminyl deacetylase